MPMHGARSLALQMAICRFPSGGIVGYSRWMDQKFKRVVDDLLRTYRENGGINYVEAAATLPSRPAIDAACVDLLSIMFPGFHGELLAHAGELPAVTTGRIKALHTRMKPEIGKSLAAVRPGTSIEEDAEDILTFF